MNTFIYLCVYKYKCLFSYQSSPALLHDVGRIDRQTDRQPLDPASRHRLPVRVTQAAETQAAETQVAGACNRGILCKWFTMITGGRIYLAPFS